MRTTVWAAVVIASAAVLVASTACSKRAPADAPGKCLALEPAVRTDLIADADRSALYWLETVFVHDFDADLMPYLQLVRFDLRTRERRVVIEHADGPLLMLQGQLIAGRRVGSYTRAVQVAADGHVQELTPGWLDVVDIEPLDRHTFVFLADGDGERGVHALDLTSLRPQYLFDADILLSAGDGTVYARKDDEGIAYDLRTRTAKRFPVIKKAIPAGDSLVFVDSNRVQIQSMISGDARTLIFEPRDWKLRHQTQSVLVRSPPRADRSYAYLVVNGRAKALTTIIGGASIVGAATIGEQTWALIGHNTTNYVGDLADTNAEADICLLPPHGGELSLQTRTVPMQFAESSARIFEAFRSTSAGALQIFRNEHEPVTFSMQLKGEPGVLDVDFMRKRTRELHERVTKLARDSEIRTEVLFSDRRRGLHRWRRERLRYQTSVGMGDALVTDVADFDVEVAGLDNERRVDKITCAGELRNPHDKPLIGVVVKCAGNRNHVIKVGDLAPHASHPFNQTFDIAYGEAAYLEVLVDNQPLRWRDLDVEARSRQVLDVAYTVYAATELSLTQHETDDGEVTVQLLAETRFLDRDRAAQEAAIMTAYEKYEALRGIYHLDAKSALTVRVEVELSDVSFTYDGTHLTRDD